MNWDADVSQKDELRTMIQSAPIRDVLALEKLEGRRERGKAGAFVIRDR
jgi:hypothetical protein